MADAKVDPIVEEYVCSICQDLLLDPVTVSCGHTCCKRCLSRWFKSNSNALSPKCPCCRASLQRQIPNVNVLLKSLIEKKFGEELSKRKKEVDQEEKEDQEKAKVASVVDAEAQVLRLRQFFQEDLQDLMNEGRRHVSHLFCAFVLVFLFSTHRPLVVNSPSQPTFNDKPIAAWTMAEVGMWLNTEGILDPSIQALSHLTGNMLLNLSPRDLEALITDGVQRQIILSAIDKIRPRIGVPTTFWEYRTKYRYQTHMILAGTLLAPRLTLAYLYFFDYNLLSVFLEPDMGPEGAWGLFISWLLSPQLLFVWFSCKFVLTHSVMIWVLAFHLLVALKEETRLVRLRDVQLYVKKCAQVYLRLSLFGVLFLILPFFLSDLCFYLWYCYFISVPFVFFTIVFFRDCVLRFLHTRLQHMQVQQNLEQQLGQIQIATAVEPMEGMEGTNLESTQQEGVVPISFPVPSFPSTPLIEDEPVLPFARRLSTVGSVV